MGAGIGRADIVARFALPVVIAAKFAMGGCGVEQHAPTDGGGRPLAVAASATPSIVLIVIDTLRADAVSAYGKVEGTTPTLDRLARAGRLYDRAYAPSSWTVPSHTSFFTGLSPEVHGVGVHGRNVAPESLEMLAETLSAAGYQTAGFSENSLVGPLVGLDQGFEIFEWLDGFEIASAKRRGVRALDEFDVAGQVGAFLRQAEPDRPFFLFLNLFDAHDPYLVRETNPFVPPGSDPRFVAETAESYPVTESICGRLPGTEELAILRGLYLGEVAAADRKVGRVLEALEDARPGWRGITVVTSDHGEHFGEHRLMGHRFTLRNAAIHVPLIVHGPEVSPTRIGEAVGAGRIYDSILCWTGLAGCAQALPIADGEAVPGAGRAIVSVASDDFEISAERRRGAKNVAMPLAGDSDRRTCTEADSVYGTMVSVIRDPLKLIWFERYDPVLHDLSWDPDELSDAFAIAPDRAGPLHAEALGIVAAGQLAGDGEAPSMESDPAIVEALRRLGYVE